VGNTGTDELPARALFVQQVADIKRFFKYPLSQTISG